MYNVRTCSGFVDSHVTIYFLKIVKYITVLKGWFHSRKQITADTAASVADPN